MTDDTTQEAPAGSLPTTDLGSVPTVDGPLAYSDHTSSMPFVDFQAPPPSLRPVWISALVLAAAAAVAAATFFLGRTTAPQSDISPSGGATTTTGPPAASLPTTGVMTPQDELADVRFRAALDANGMPLAAPIVALGRPVCTHLQAGDTLDRAAERVMTDLQWSWEWAHYFATSAVEVYCSGFEWTTKTAVNPSVTLPKPLPAGTASSQSGDTCTELHAVTRDALGQTMWCNPLMTGDHSLHWMYGGPS